MDFRAFLSAYEESFPEQVVHVHREVDARFDISAIGIKAQKELREAPLLIFHKVRTVDGELSPWPVVVNVFASRRRCAFAVGGTYERLGREMYERRLNRVKPAVVSRSHAPVKEVIKTGEAAKARELPALVHLAWDPGPYIPAGFLTTYDPDSGIDNTGLRRGWIVDDHEIRGLFQGHDGINIRKREQRGEDARVAFWIGHHPAVYLGAGVHQGYPESHWEACEG